MIPILLDGTTRIGWLKDCLSCEVTEERNGVYELTLTYPASGSMARELTVERFIKAKPNQTAENQLFKIYKVSKPINGIFTVNAEHVSYALSHYPISSVSLPSANPTQAINALLTNAANNLGSSHGFTVETSDIATNAAFHVSNVSARAGLGGVEGSVLDTYGGEFEFDNYKIKLHRARGSNNGVIISYGKNLTDVKCDISSDSSYTAVYAYAARDDISVSLTMPVTNSSGIAARVLMRDFSSEFGTDEELTSAALNEKVTAWLASNDINALTISMSVSFVDLSQSPEYSSYKLLERVNLCDTVTVRHKDLALNITAKVIKTTYNVLNEKYSKVELGSARANFSSTIEQLQKETQSVKHEVHKTESKITQEYLAAIQDATAAITGNSGGYIRLNPAENPQELLIMNTPSAETATKIWRWNLSGLGYSSTGYSGSYKTAITQDGHIVADFIDTGTWNANIIKAGIMQSANGEFSFNLETGHIEASDINITGGDINLDGGTLSILNNDGYKADLSGGVLDLYQGAGTGTGTGEKYLTFGSSMLLTTAISGNWYATIAAPEFTLGEQSSKGFRFGTSTLNASAAMPAVGGLAYNWTTDYMLVEKDKTRIRRCVETNEAKYDQFESLIHHRTVGGTNFKLGVGIAKMNANKTPGAGFEIRGETSGKLWAGLYAWTEADNIMRLTFQTSNQDGTTYSRTLTANGDFLYFNGRRLKFVDEDK